MKKSEINKIKTLGDAHAATLGPDAQQYWRENADRIAQNLVVVGTLCASQRTERVLDIGPSYQTVLLKKMFPAIRVETMGWEDPRYRATPDTVHHALDLNCTAEPETCAVPEPVDLILFLEVIEHLHTSPRHVLRYLFRCLKPGGVLIVSTPNAAFLRNRWRLLWGINPYEKIREDSGNPGHFREYTAAELEVYCRETGFEVLETRIENLYRFGAGSGRFFSRLTQFMPANFRHDLMVIVRRPA